MKNKNKILNLAFVRIIPMGLLFAGVSSCTISQPMARETDGIYYDPNVDVREVAVCGNDYGDDVYYDTRYYSQKPSDDKDFVRIGGKYFDENGNAPISEYKSDWNKKKRNNPRYSEYSTWGDVDKDVDVSINYFGSPYYSGFGWGLGFGMGYNWYSPRFYGGYYPYSYYNNFWGWDYPFYGGYGYYSPYYGYNSWAPYTPYYGYNNPYYYDGGYYGSRYYAPYYVKPVNRKERGADSIFRGNSNRTSNYQTNNNNYNNRNSNSNNVFRTESRSIRNNNNRKTYNNSNWNNSYNSSTSPNYNNTYRSTPSVSSPRNNSYNGSSNGFRKGAFR